MDNAQEASKFLVDYALRKGSQDNVTVLVIRLRSVPEDVLASATEDSSDSNNS
jgi:serine/threonine protein phosphatase PrpC